MRDILSSTWRLAESPELVVLHVLDATVAAAEVALLATHPELENLDSCAEAPPALSTDAYVADALLTSITALRSALERYVGLLRRRSTARLVRIDDP